MSRVHQLLFWDTQQKLSSLAYRTTYVHSPEQSWTFCTSHSLQTLGLVREVGREGKGESMRVSGREIGTKWSIVMKLESS